MCRVSPPIRRMQQNPRTFFAQTFKNRSNHQIEELEPSNCSRSAGSASQRPSGRVVPVQTESETRNHLQETETAKIEANFKK